MQKKYLSTNKSSIYCPKISPATQNYTYHERAARTRRDILTRLEHLTKRSVSQSQKMKNLQWNLEAIAARAGVKVGLRLFVELEILNFNFVVEVCHAGESKWQNNIKESSK